MVVLRSLLLAALAPACYSPEVRDCTVTCNALADCAPDQVCGSDGFCAAEDVAGRCATIAAPNDAGTDARRPDAPPDASPDAWPTVQLFISIEGRGVVAVATVGECDGGGGQATCPFQVPVGVALTMFATPKNNWRFDGWSEACAGSPTATCAITPGMSNVTARVRFVEDDDDD